MSRRRSSWDRRRRVVWGQDFPRRRTPGQMRIYSYDGREESAVFPSTEASVGEARRWSRKILGDHPRLDDAVLLLSEIFTNAVTHAASPEIHVTVLTGWDRSVEVKVTDRGTATVPCACRAPADPLAERGRGIRLVRELSRRWRFLKDATGCTVWFILDPYEPPGDDEPPAAFPGDRRATYQEVHDGRGIGTAARPAGRATPPTGPATPPASPGPVTPPGGSATPPASPGPVTPPGGSATPPVGPGPATSPGGSADSSAGPGG
ncbi:ATP-binding protein [Sphaerisporangium dianthi]|uniref:ATP-binding protein n=1 Tax=Sphaerisporangium dianthi TaxID=1436120 RepID=A0ABV9CPC9_9ACTN